MPSEEEMSSMKEKMKECLGNEGHAHLSKFLFVFFLSSRNKNGGYVNSNFFYISQADINVIDHCMRFSCGIVTDRLSLALVSFTPCLGF